MWKHRAKGQVPHITTEPDDLIFIGATFHYPMYTKAGKLRKFDSPNLLKLLIDAITESMGVDDCRVKSGTWDTVDDEDEWVDLIVRIYKKEETHATN